MNTTLYESQQLKELYETLDRRVRPEEVAKMIIALTGEKGRYHLKLLATEGGRSYMSDDFYRPIDMTKQVKSAKHLFKSEFVPNDVQQIFQWLKKNSIQIGKKEDVDFKGRLNREQRKKAGIDLNHRQYNKRFRFLIKAEKRAAKLQEEYLKRSLTLASCSRLGQFISWEDFSSDLNTACFIAYYVSRCNLRSIFTNSTQLKPFDQICDQLMQELTKSDTTNWWAIAHVLPSTEIVAHLSNEQKGQLLGQYFNLLQQCAEFLELIYRTTSINDDMIVQRGNDSTTWNITAGAWNKLRAGWFSLVYSLGLLELVEQMCPGKVLRLIAADVAYWHRSTGGKIHEDTAIWTELPRPWQVLLGTLQCSKTMVEQVCTKYGVDPIKSGWSAPAPGRTIEKVTFTPELVHGVIVSSPELAKTLRKLGVFSGKDKFSLSFFQQK